MVKTPKPDSLTPTGPIDCACVIHGDVYTWNYVENLHAMLSRHITPGIRLHVYTESHRKVPEPFIKHELIDWGFKGAKKSWWYKMQLFDVKQHRGPLLYFDLDTVIVSNLDWLWQSPLRYFWTVRDFKYLWKPHSYSINSSVMWWDTERYAHVWTDFAKQDIPELTRRYRGDQDYLATVIDHQDCRYLNEQKIKSWRWQNLDGGYDFRRKIYRSPGTGTGLAATDSVLVFHGQPKPNELTDSVILKHWQKP